MTADPTPFRTPSYAEEALADALEREKRTDPTPYTPTDDPVVLTDEQMEAEYLTTWTPGNQDEGRDRWRAWLAARDARIRAEAVRDAADCLDREAAERDAARHRMTWEESIPASHFLAETHEGRTLRARAASIEQETQT